MKKNKTLSSILGFSGLCLAIIALFMCFGAGITMEDGPLAFGIRLFDYVFHTGVAKTIMDAAGEKFGVTPYLQPVWIVGFAMILISIISVASVCILNVKNKGSKKVNLILTSVAIFGLLFFVSTMFATKALVLNVWPAEAIEDMKEHVKLGAGAICGGTFGLLAAGSLVGSVLTNPNK